MEYYNFTFLFCGLLMPEAAHQHRAVRSKLPRLSSALPAIGKSRAQPREAFHFHPLAGWRKLKRHRIKKVQLQNCRSP